jgi:alpha-beta hydrolase superfamily lysophospholipase
MLAVLKVAAGLVAGASILTFLAPVVGEAIATLPPVFPRAAGAELDALDLPYEDVQFATSDGLILRGWFIPAEKANAPAVLYAPATSHDQRSGLSLVPELRAAGYHSLLFSYRGHGASDGARGKFTYGSSESIDVDAAVRYLHDTRGINRIGIIGHSAGAVSGILSGARNAAVGAVVAVAPFTCIDDIWQTNRPALVPRAVMNWTLWLSERWRGFNRNEICPVEVIDRISPRPLLLIHGLEDKRITEEQAREIFDAARQPKSLWLVEGATHSGVREQALDALVPQVITFLNQALQVPPNHSSGQPDSPKTWL